MTIPVECVHDRVEVVTRVKISEQYRALAARAAAPRSTGDRDAAAQWQAEPLDDWTDGLVEDPPSHTASGGTQKTPQVKVRVRCHAPSCTYNLEASPELADRLVDWLLATERRRVDLRDLVSVASTLGY